MNSSDPIKLPNTQIYLLNLIAFLLKQLGGSIAISDIEGAELINVNQNLELITYKTELGSLIIEVKEK